jgi:hypothetical protein
MKPKPKTGRLLWIEKGTYREIVVIIGPFQTLQIKRAQLKLDPAWSNGTFKITY